MAAVAGQMELALEQQHRLASPGRHPTPARRPSRWTFFVAATLGLAGSGDRRTSLGPPKSATMARRAQLINVLPGYLWLVLYQLHVCDNGPLDCAGATYTSAPSWTGSAEITSLRTP